MNAGHVTLNADGKTLQDNPAGRVGNWNFLKDKPGYMRMFFNIEHPEIYIKDRNMMEVTDPNRKPSSRLIRSGSKATPGY